MRVLGISAFHRDAAAALVEDGVIVAAAKEEHFTKKRHDPAFPKRAIRSCLDQAGVRGADLDRVVFYEKPLRKFERLLVTQLRAFPRSSRSFAQNMFLWLGDRMWVKNRIAGEVGVPHDRVWFCEQQRAHAAAAFYLSPFDSAALLVVDDAGEWAASTLAQGSQDGIEVLAESHLPSSLGFVVSAVTQYLGFEPGREEPKVEALAMLGAPRFAEELGGLLPETGNGSFTVDARAFRFAFDGERLFDAGLVRALGPSRNAGEPLLAGGPDSRHADVAASLQAVVEQRVLALASELARRTGSPNLCFTGEVAKNRGVVARLLEESPFERVFVPPEPGKAGGALGAALDGFAGETGERPRRHSGAPFGEELLGRAGDEAHELGGNGAVRVELARRLAAGERVAWARGRMDFSAHSLGSRSIFTSPTRTDSRTELLGALQRTEPFLPCRVAIAADRAGELLHVPSGALDALRLGAALARPLDALAAAAPAALNADGRVWPQLVDERSDPELHGLLTMIGAETGVPALLHASFRPRGAPIVRTEADATEAYGRSRLDALVCDERLYAR